MRWRLYDPPPDSLKSVPPERRRDILRAVRAGEAVQRKKDAKVAVDTAQWMVGQFDQRYLELITAPISMIAAAVIVVLGFVQTGNVWAALSGLVPLLAMLAIVRLVGRLLFRKAPQALEANRALVQRRRS